MFSGNILFNFFEAEEIDINAVIFGSILAPKANINSPYGAMWGQVIADSWSGNAQINDNAFISENYPFVIKDSVAVPEP